MTVPTWSSCDNFSICTGLYELLLSLIEGDTLPRILPIALIQEPNVYCGKITGFKWKLTLVKGLNPRAGIVTLPCANMNLLDQISNDDSTFSLLNLKGSCVCLSSFYHDVNRNQIDFDYYVDYSGNPLIVGDTNAHSSLWGSQQNNARGDAWEEYIFEKNLYI